MNKKKITSYFREIKFIPVYYNNILVGHFFSFHEKTLSTKNTVIISKLTFRIGCFILLLGLFSTPTPFNINFYFSSHCLDILRFFNFFQFFLFFGDLNVLLLFFFFIFGTFLITTNTALHLLLTAELLWITLYAIVLFVGLVFDNINFLSLTFFFLIFSAVEFGVGLIFLLLQHLLIRSLSLYDNDTNLFKFVNRFNRNININRLLWKY